MAEMKAYVVESYSRWFVVYARTQAEAKREGRREYNSIRSVRIATEEDIAYYLSVRGSIGTIE